MTDIKDVKFEKANELWAKMKVIMDETECDCFDIFELASRLRILSFITFMDGTKESAPSSNAFEEMMEKFLEMDAEKSDLTPIYKDRLMEGRKQ